MDQLLPLCTGTNHYVNALNNKQYKTTADLFLGIQYFYLVTIGGQSWYRVAIPAWMNLIINSKCKQSIPFSVSLSQHLILNKWTILYLYASSYSTNKPDEVYMMTSMSLSISYKTYKLYL